METTNYIPALKYHWLTKLYDPILQLTMPEREMKSALLTKANISSRQNILDFGCGSLTLSIMGKAMYPNAQFFGVDVDPKIIDIAKTKVIKEHQNIQVSLYEGHILPYENCSFDRVISSLVFHHLTFKQKADALKEILRVLKPNGELHLCDFGFPQSRIQRFLFYSIQLLDGFTTTSDNVKGLLPTLIEEAGFKGINEEGVFRTAFGTIRIIKAIKPTETIL
jgi:ubiquinone/menaquinone biosynthesis C-methylase UbiE